MNCNQARRMVAPFVKNELSDKDTEAFLQHIETCDDCMDELDIYYTAYNAVDLLDSEDRQGYDFEKRLSETIHSKKRGIFRRKMMHFFRLTLAVLILILILLCSGLGIYS